MGTRGLESEQTCTMEVGQYTPVVNALVDAASEQKMQSHSGLSGVQTPSIYLTPAGGANAVHLNTGNYVTPELFSLPGTAYHTAQSTIAQFGSGTQPTITPGSEKSGVDSGYGPSQNSQTSGVPDSAPRSNSNGQQTEQGMEQSTRTQLPPLSGKPVETEQRKVLVFNTDTEDSAQSDDRQRSRERASSEKRGNSKKVSKDPAGSDRKKRSTSKVGKDSVDSDRRGRSKSRKGKSPTESVDKKQTSKLRRARSASRRRKKKPHKDESSSSSSSSSERAASSKKSASKKGPKVIPESNSPSSSTSDSDEAEDTATVRRVKHMLKPPKFDGHTSFKTFWAQFENCAEHNNWNRAQKLVLLKNSLTGDAANVLWDYGKEVCLLYTSPSPRD